MKPLSSFKLEEYFGQYEFVAPYMMGSSDPETLTLSELVGMANAESLLLWNNLRLCYTEQQGLPLLREEISKLYEEINKENVLVFSGAEEAIYICLKTILNPNDHVVVLTPCYQSLKEIPKSVGANVTEFSLTWKNNTWFFDIEEFESIITNKTKCVVLNFPNNPTGFHPSPSLFSNIVSIVKKHNAYLFCDEVYRLSEQNQNDRLPNACDIYDNALSLGVMSKSFGLPGLRIGWIATQNQSLLKDFISYKNYTTISNSAPSEILSVIALQNKEKILDRNKTIAKNNLDLLDTFFKKYDDFFEWCRPAAGFIGFPKLTLNMPIEAFCEQFIENEGVIMLPGFIFDNTENHFRIGFGRKNFHESLSRLDRFTEKVMKSL